MPGRFMGAIKLINRQQKLMGCFKFTNLKKKLLLPNSKKYLTQYGRKS